VDATVSIYFGGTATDVTDAVRTLSIRRGRSRELDTFTSGSCSFTLNNRDRRFDPLYPDGPYFGQIRPRLRVTVVSDGVSLFDGFIEDINLDYDLSSQSLVDVTCIDGLALLSQTALTEYTNAQDTPAERIQAVLARSEVSYSGGTDLDPGFNPMQADTVSMTPTRFRICRRSQIRTLAGCLWTALACCGTGIALAASWRSRG
jgi:hypothetical protein